MSDEVAQAYREALGIRIAEAVSRFPTKTAAAQAAGVTVEQLNKWIKGSVKVPADGLHGLAREGNVDFSWLASGENRKAKSGDVARAVAEGMKIVSAVLWDVYKAEGVKIPPGNLIAEMREYTMALIEMLDDPEDLQEWQTLVPWLENRIRKSLKEPGTGKHAAS